jgi:hypothetical protein
MEVKMDRRMKMVKYALLVVGILAVLAVFLLFFLPTRAFGTAALVQVLTATWWIYLVIIALCFVLYFIIKLLFGKKK